MSEQIVTCTLTVPDFAATRDQPVDVKRLYGRSGSPIFKVLDGYAWNADGLLNRTTFKPQPDFYIAWIYRQLFSRTYPSGTDIEAVPVNMSQTAEVTGMRVFMFAARGSEERIFVSTPQ